MNVARTSGVVRARDSVRLDDTPIDGTVPKVIAQRAEYRLVDRPADQLGCERIVVLKGIWHVLKPECVRCLHVSDNLVCDHCAGPGGIDEFLPVTPSLKRRTKKSSQDVKPQWGLSRSATHVF